MTTLIFNCAVVVDHRVTVDEILYRYFVALREIYQNVCPEVPGNPRDVIFPDAEGH